MQNYPTVPSRFPALGTLNNVLFQKAPHRAFLVLLNTLSHSVDIAGIERVSKAI